MEGGFSFQQGSVARLCVAIHANTLRLVGDDSYSNRSATLLSALVVDLKDRGPMDERLAGERVNYARTFT